ncbi:MAG: cupin domain-containing protein [Alphaproteobacteria bacterium]|nr:MAG: cupin domain-containing protein [Alphaproteobacteria bacterium]
MKRFVTGLAATVLFAAAAQAGEVKPLMQADTDIIGGALSYPEGKPVISAVEITVLPGEANTWHSHPVPTFGYTVSGVLTVYYANGDKRVILPGQTIVEAQHTPHYSRNEGTEVVKLIVFYAGAEGVQNTIPAPAPEHQD